MAALAVSKSRPCDRLKPMVLESTNSVSLFVLSRTFSEVCR